MHALKQAYLKFCSELQPECARSGQTLASLNSVDPFDAEMLAISRKHTLSEFRDECAFVLDRKKIHPLS